MKVSNEDFVVAWMTSKDIDGVIATTGLTRPSVSYRKKRLKKAGVNLPDIVRQSRGLDKLEVAQLNSLIRKYRKYNGAEV